MIQATQVYHDREAWIHQKGYSVLIPFTKGGRSMEPSDVNEQSQSVRLADTTAPAPQDVPKQSVRWTTDTIIVNGNPLTILFPESD